MKTKHRPLDVTEVYLLKQMGGKATAKQLCDRLTETLCCSRAQSQLIIQRAISNRKILVADNWDLVLP